MRKIDKPADALVGRYATAILKHLIWAKVVSGKREKAHILIADPALQPNGYTEPLCDGLLPKMMPCRAPTMSQERCPKCDAALKALAVAVADRHRADLFAQAGAGGVVTVDRGDFSEAATTTMPLPDEFLPTGSGLPIR